MADLKLTATALYVDRYCEIGEKKTKSIEELPDKTLHLLINIGKRNVIKNKYLHKNCRKIVERKYLTCYASISFSLILVSQ